MKIVYIIISLILFIILASVIKILYTHIKFKKLINKNIKQIEEAVREFESYRKSDYSTNRKYYEDWVMKNVNLTFLLDLRVRSVDINPIVRENINKYLHYLQNGEMIINKEKYLNQVKASLKKYPLDSKNDIADLPF